MGTDGGGDTGAVPAIPGTGPRAPGRPEIVVHARGCFQDGEDGRRTDWGGGGWFLAAAGIIGWNEIAPEPEAPRGRPQPGGNATAAGDRVAREAGQYVRTVPEPADRLLGVEPADPHAVAPRSRELVSSPRRRRPVQAVASVRSRGWARRRHRWRSWQQEARTQTWQRAVAGSALVAVSGALGLVAVQHPISMPSLSFDARRTDVVPQTRPVFAPVAVTVEQPQVATPLDSPLSGVAPGGVAGTRRPVSGTADAGVEEKTTLLPQTQRAREYARSRMAAFGWNDPNEMASLDRLWTRESGWRVDATNSKSGAYGIPQALPASKLASAGADWRTNPRTQIDWGLAYIHEQYGSPSKALTHRQSTGWY